MPPKTTTEVILTDSPSRRETLTGRANYLGWSKIVMCDLIEKNYFVPGSPGSWTPEHAAKAKTTIMKYLSLAVASLIDDDLDAEAIWMFLKLEYGENDPYILKRELKSVTMVGIDLEKFWNAHNIAWAKFKNAGGKMPFDEVIELVLDFING